SPTPFGCGIRFQPCETRITRLESYATATALQARPISQAQTARAGSHSGLARLLSMPTGLKGGGREGWEKLEEEKDFGCGSSSIALSPRREVKMIAPAGSRWWESENASSGIHCRASIIAEPNAVALCCRNSSICRHAWGEYQLRNSEPSGMSTMAVRIP